MPLKLSQMVQVGLPTSQFAAAPKLIEEVAWEEEIGNSRVLREPVGVRRRDHALELPAEPDRRQGRARPGRRLHGRAEAERGDAAERLPAGRGDRGRRPARRRLQPRHRHRAGGRRGDRRPSRRRHGLLHRLDPGRQAGQRARLGDGEAGGDGARRQVAEPDPRRRRPRARRSRRRRQVLPQLGPDLQRADPDAGAARAAGRGRGARRRGRRGLHPRRPVRPVDPARAARLRGPARARPRLHREGRGRGRASCSPAAPRRRTASTAATSSAPPSSPR